MLCFPILITYYASVKVFLIVLVFLNAFRVMATCRKVVGDFISYGITTLYWLAQCDLRRALSRYFEEDLHYKVLLDKVQHLFAEHPDENYEVLSLIKLLQDQQEIYSEYRTFSSGKCGLTPPSVEILENLIEAMKKLASHLELANCAEEIGTILYDVKGPEVQLLRGKPVVVRRGNCTSELHEQLSKIALFTAHSPSGSEVSNLLQ